MGILIVGAMGLYLLIAFGVVIGAISHARKHGKSTKRWGWGAALVMYLIPFWDWIPTVAVHQYYCATEAGFWVYKTPEQWKKENPGVMETLVAQRIPVSKFDGDENNFVSTASVNQRFNWITKLNGPLFLNRWRNERVLMDVKGNEVLARYVGFSSSHIRREAGWSGWKFWLAMDDCIGGRNLSLQYGKFVQELKGAEK